MSRVPRWAWLAVAAGFVAVVGLGLYLGLRTTAEHQVEWGRRLAALDHQTSGKQIGEYKAELAAKAADCGMAEMDLAASVTVAQKGRPEATAWGLLESASPSHQGCQQNLLYVGAGVGDAPSTLPGG